MYVIENEAVIGAINSDCRTFRALIESGERKYTAGQIGRVTTEHTQTQTDGLQLGAVLSRRAEIMLYNLPDEQAVPHKGDDMMLYLYLLKWGNADLTSATHRELAAFTHREIAAYTASADPDGAPLEGSMLPFGRYRAARVRRTGAEIRVEAFDRLQDTDAVYVPAITFPASSEEVLDDICTQLGIPGHRYAEAGALVTSDVETVCTSEEETVIVSAEYTFTIGSAPSGMTFREVIGGIAAMYGGNAVLDREGYLTTMFFSGTVQAIDPDRMRQRIDEPELDDADVWLSGMICHAGETVYSVGDLNGAHIVEFDCPWMTEGRFYAVWRQMQSTNLTWRPGEVHYRLADPRLDLGDQLSIPFRMTDGSAGQCKMPLTSLVYQFDGGLSADLESAGSAEGGY